ncbi:AAA family ATPase [Paenibacillus sp. V4I5]|uniref:AAA family ATPase n=1 Tax=Paenibacillus sp. V4I5 TaxID=3042306 RepID=UPI00279330A4|nr:AAA family ATPase [Paenibacillus sp. V4I5]MDQ0919156.1 putative ATP-dependent endonuclease of OLD family [Paenibacillus sp. V4I5]
MFIEEIKVEKYKKLNNFVLKFNKIDNEDFNLSVLIGENGTSKTTILQLIVNILSRSREKDKMINSFIKYKINDNSYTLTNYNVPEQLPSKLIISSFTPVEKIYNQAKLSKAAICPVFYSQMGVSKLKDIIVKYVTESTRESKNLGNIVRYIGYNPNQLYLEFNEGVDSSSLDTFLRRLYSGKYDDISESILRNLDLNIDPWNLVFEYENVLRDYGRLRRTISHYFEKLDVINDHNHRSRLSKIEIERIYIEYLYANLKMKSFSNRFSNSMTTYYKGGDQRLVSLFDLNSYFTGKDGFENDLHFLEKLDRYAINDLWFMSDGTTDFVPLSLWSSGELSLFLRLSEISDSISENSLLLIDEPETHLHPKWIKSYISILKSIIRVNCHVIIATHAPLIVSDIPKENIILLKKEGHLINQNQIEEETVGLEYEDILKKIFDVDEKNGTVLETYEQKIVRCLEENDLDSAIKLYDQLGNSPTKYELFLKIKKYYEQRKSRE